MPELRLAVLGSILTGIAYPGGRQAASAADAVLAQRSVVDVAHPTRTDGETASLLLELAH